MSGYHLGPSGFKHFELGTCATAAEFEAVVTNLAERGWNDRQISEAVGVSRTKIIHLLAALGIPLSSQTFKNPESPRTAERLAKYFSGATFTPDGFPVWATSEEAKHSASETAA